MIDIEASMAFIIGMTYIIGWYIFISVENDLFGIALWMLSPITVPLILFVLIGIECLIKD